MIGLRICFQRTLLVALTLCLAVFGLAISAHADATTRAARLTYMQGTVTVNQPGLATGVPAQMNLPLLSGIQLVTGADGQAEVEFEDGSVARLTPNSALSLDNLSVEPSGVFTTSLSLLHGLAYFELRATPQYVYTIAAGGDVLTPVENTTVRVDFDEPPAIFSVLDGTAHVERQINPSVDAANAGYQTDVRAGESLRADTSDPTRYFLTPGIAADSWDQWNEDMDQADAAEAANSTTVRDNYAGAEGYGWSDLDADGTWYDVPGQGPVWQPQMAMDDSGFDPYGDGDWVDYPGVGYVWASAYPWGWTPYRCGLWSYYNSFGWGWAPGLTCGGLGWGFLGGGVPVNIGLVPVGYRPIRVPIVGPHPLRPVLPVHTYQPVAPAQPVAVAAERQIDGKTVVAIKPVGNSFSSAGAVGGTSLGRDFPVDSKTHAPVLGLASTRPAAVHTTEGLPAPGPASTMPARAVQPAYDRQSRPEPSARTQPASPPAQRPAQQTAPVHRYYSPPSRPAYTPRPYSPPPPAFHPAPPPPAPAARPR